MTTSSMIVCPRCQAITQPLCMVTTSVKSANQTLTIAVKVRFVNQQQQPRGGYTWQQLDLVKD